MTVATPNDPAITEDLRTRLAVIADRLIPPADGMPAPSRLGISGRQLDAVLASRPDLIEDLKRALCDPNDDEDAIEWTRGLQTRDPAAHEALVLTILAGYYMHAEVKAALGYPGQIPQEVNAGIFPAYVSEGLLERVVERGSLYRPTPQ